VGKMREDWQEYHDEPWPGIESVINISSPFLDAQGRPTVREYEAIEENDAFRADLHQKWYKRRVGISPPEDSESWRPWSIGDVEAAYQRDVGNVRITPEAVGIDVARKVDETVMIGLHDQQAQVEYVSQESHDVQRRELVDFMQGKDIHEKTVDAIGKGEPIADELNSRFPEVYHFGNNEVAVDEDNYRYKWDEGLQLIGEWLRDGGSFSDQKLYEELKVGASVLEFEERSLASRGGKIIQATPKDELKDALGRSPDRLDALLMCIWGKQTEASGQNVPLAW